MIKTYQIVTKSVKDYLGNLGVTNYLILNKSGWLMWSKTKVNEIEQNMITILKLSVTDIGVKY